MFFGYFTSRSSSQEREHRADSLAGSVADVSDIRFNRWIKFSRLGTYFILHPVKLGLEESKWGSETFGRLCQILL